MSEYALNRNNSKSALRHLYDSLASRSQLSHYDTLPQRDEATPLSQDRHKTLKTPMTLMGSIDEYYTGAREGRQNKFQASSTQIPVLTHTTKKRSRAEKGNALELASLPLTKSSSSNRLKDF